MPAKVNEDNLREVSSVMVKRVVTFKKDDSILKVAKKMADSNISCIVVAEKDKKPLGILTERDIIKKLVQHDKKIVDKKVNHVMTTPVMSVKPDDELVPVGDMMKKKRVRRFPVVNDKGKLVGLVTQTDILQGIIHLVKHLDWQLIKAKITVEDYIEKLKENSLI